ncbi:MAG: class I adenylate-forming enzyme family protein [Thermodesulfobacteriota bacterium]
MNIGEWVYKRALLYPERTFLKQAGEGVDNRRFNEQVNRTAHAFQDLGLNRGDRVAVLMANSGEFLEVLFACAKLGLMMVPLNTQLAVSELNYILEDADPQILIYTAGFSDKVASIKTAQTGIRAFFQHGETATGVGADPSFSSLMSTCPFSEPIIEGEVDLRDALMILYTSGTTGDPKGAVLCHQNFLFGAIHSLIGYGIDESYVSLVVAPLFHIGALAASVVPVVYAGGSLLIESFDNPSDIVELIVRERVNYMFGVPVMFGLMTRSPRWADADFSHVHFFIAGGAPMPVPLIQKYQQEKSIRFAQGYGMTETLRIASLGLDDAVRKQGSVGKEVFNTFIRIIDEKGNEAPAGGIGEILVKGPTVFLHYWNKPEATAAAFQDGWFRTGDLGRRDEDRFLYIVGRKTDLIISSGRNIYATEVERAIQALPPVAEAAVVGEPDSKRGEIVVAYVRLKPEETPGKMIDEWALIESLQGNIAPFKIPKKICFVTDFPRTGAGKILKRCLSPQSTPLNQDGQDEKG